MNYKNTLSIILLISFILANCQNNNTKNKVMNNQEKQIIIDVRSEEEWQFDGHADCSVNYPLDIFESKIDELKKFDRIILVCRSGNRAGIAKRQLMNAGYTNEIENLGAWQNVSCN